MLCAQNSKGKDSHVFSTRRPCNRFNDPVLEAAGRHCRVATAVEVDELRTACCYAAEANIRQFRAFTDVQLCQIGYHLRFCGLAAVALVIKEKYVVCNHIKVLEIKMRK